MNRGLDRIGSARWCTAIVAVLLSVAAGGCARHPAPSFDAAAARRAILDPPRSQSGNPPFYEVFGQRHFVLDSAVGYRRTGIASWYGEQFHGLATSSGDTYDMFGLTAAHTTLPIPTWVEVTHLGNGKRVIVKVNDRGPFRDNRIIDLSYGADELQTAGYRQISIDADHGASPNLFRVRLGPFTDVDAVDRAIDSLVALGLEKPHLVIGP